MNRYFALDTVEQRRANLGKMLGIELQTPTQYDLGAESKRSVTAAPQFETRAVNEEERSIVYAFTSSVIDRYEEVVDPNGADMRNFQKSKRTIFWNHSQDRPIGRSLWEKKDGETWLTKVQFAAEQNAFANDIWRLAKDDFIGATSIGFMPKTAELIQNKNLKDLHPSNQSEFDPEQLILVWRNWELFEISVVGVPANPEALEVERVLRSGEIKSDEIRNILVATLQEKRICELEACREEMKGSVEQRTAELDHRMSGLMQVVDALGRVTEELKSKIDETVKRRAEMETAIEQGAKQRLIEDLIARSVDGAINRMRGRID